LSKLIETRIEFQQLAERRLVEAKALLNLGFWDGAYYLAGYAVELGLKACIIKMLLATDAFPDKDLSRDCYTHSVSTLIKVSRLREAEEAATDADPLLKAHWGLVKDWSEQKRYHMIEQNEAEGLYTAIAGNGHGVLSWIKTVW
jgi:hypothetical protein